MFSFVRSCRGKKALAASLAVALMLTVAGCAKQGQQQAPQATLVKSMQVIKRDTPIVYDYTGFVEAQQEMELKAQVTGQIIGKYFKGGDTVKAGQVLYTIDPRTYQANLLNAQAGLANARATLAKAALDAERYTKLYEANAVSKQVMDNAIMIRDQAQAGVDAQEAMLANAQKDINETTVTAPFNGRIDTTALEVGNFVTVGQTTLAKISDTDPVYVKFSVSEAEYLKLKGTNNSLENLEAVLADGSTYPLKGKVAEVNRGISDGTGTLTIRAIYQNPDRKLLPGMFAHVRAIGGTKEGALLIPQRAITELMYKKFVYVIGNDNKVAMKEVTLGQNVGRLVVVESGLEGSENLVVEGTSKMSNGVTVNAQPITEADLDTAVKAEQKK